MRSSKLTTFFKNIDKEDIGLVGGKGANLGEMTKEGFPVPPGFVVTVKAYQAFLKENDLEGRIYSVLNKLDVNDASELELFSQRLQRLVLTSPVPTESAKEIFASYKKLSGVFKKELVAVRSSATAEDLPGASFAGQQATFFNIQGEANLVSAVRACWASLFTERAIFYRSEKGFDHFKVGLAAVVQRMVQSSQSGIMFTVDPVDNNKNTLIIEAIYGLGEYIVQGKVTPDQYLVDKAASRITSKKIGYQDVKFVKSGVNNIEEKLRNAAGSNEKINDSQI